MPMAVPLTLIEGVEGEVVVGKDEASEGYEEIGGRAFRKELLKSRMAMSMRDVGIQGGSINGDKQDIGRNGVGKDWRMVRK